MTGKEGFKERQKGGTQSPQMHMMDNMEAKYHEIFSRQSIPFKRLSSIVYFCFTLVQEELVEESEKNLDLIESLEDQRSDIFYSMCKATAHPQGWSNKITYHLKNDKPQQTLLIFNKETSTKTSLNDEW